MRVALISCVKTKATKKCQAKDLYQGSWFPKAYAYAKKQNVDKILILSAMHHVLEETEPIKPYELTLNKMSTAERRAWAEEVLKQLSAKTDLEHDEFLILAGEKYRQGLVGAIKQYQVPMKDLPWGKQLQFLKEALES